MAQEGFVRAPSAAKLSLSADSSLCVSLHSLCAGAGAPRLHPRFPAAPLKATLPPQEGCS